MNDEAQRSDDIIYVHPSPSADTRSADHEITEDELLQSTKMHIDDVVRGMKWLALKLCLNAERHDWTKIKYRKEFFDQFSKAQQTGDWGTGWYDQIHLKKERHHLDDIDSCPDDVNLLDVLEQIVDGVMAGMARTGRYEPRPIDPFILSMAYENTCRLLAEHVAVVGIDKGEETK